MLRFLKTRTFRVLGTVALLIVLYAIAGFVVAPKLLRSALLKDIPASIDATPAVGEIRVNPFLFQVTVDNFSLTGRGGEKLLGFQRLFIDFELSSIWHRAYSFANIDIASPYVGAVVAHDGTLNLLQLRPKPTSKPAPEQKTEPLPALRIGSFKVSQGLVTYEDRSRPDVFAARLEPLNFELREFTTGVEGGRFTFTGSSKLGERIEWHGHVSVQPLESDGGVRIDGLLAHTLWEYLEGRLNFVVNSGKLDLESTYKFSAGNAGGSPANLQLDVSRATLSDLTVRPKDSEENWVTVPELAVTGTTVDLAKRQVHVDRVSLTGIKLLTWLEPDGSFNLMKLAGSPAASPTAALPTAGSPATAPPAGSHPATGSVTSAPTLANNAPVDAAAWQFDLRQFDLRDASLSAEDRTVRPAVKVLLAPLSLQLNGASQDLSKPVGLTLDTHVNGTGSLKIEGQVTPQPAAADLSLKLTDIDLAVIQPYVAQHSSMTLLSGQLGGDGKMHYGAPKTAPALRFSGDISVEKLHTVDNTLHDDFINWDRLDILGLNYTQGPDRLDIEQIVARKLYARVIIEQDESVNVKRVLVVPGTAPSGAAPPTSARASKNSPTPGKDKPATPQAVADRSDSPTMPMSIKKVVFRAGEANFSDLSVQPNFSAGISKLEGTITGLSSKAGSRAKIDLHGSVGAFSPVSVTGEFNVLGPQLYTDIAMGFHNIDLSVFNPYSGKFAGYDIAKGKLNTDLHYKVDGRKLDAQHHIMVEQLEFGDKTASKDAVSLPIKLAVALLKDRNGVIDLNLPVTGSLDDPQFRLAPIIWKVFINILEKAVTAPFALLGSLFGSGPDIQFIDFQPGVGTLDPAAADKAKAVGKALIERPQLKIEVPIGVVAEVDRPALVAAQFNEQVSTAQTVKSKRQQSTPPGQPLTYEQLDPAAQLELLTRTYVKDFGSEPKFPDVMTGLKSKPELTAAKIDFLSKAIHEHIQIGDTELQALGQQRAMTLQQVLLADPQVTAERVFLVANDKAVAKDGVVRLELSLR